MYKMDIVDRVFLWVAKVAGFILLVIWKGYALSYAWNALVVTTLGVRQLTTLGAIGVCFVATYLVHTPSNEDFEDKTEKEKITQIAYWIVNPAFLMGYTWILIQFGT